MPSSRVSPYAFQDRAPPAQPSLRPVRSHVASSLLPLPLALKTKTQQHVANINENNISSTKNNSTTTATTAIAAATTSKSQNRNSRPPQLHPLYQTRRERRPPPPRPLFPAFCQAKIAAVLVPGARHFTETGINDYHVCNDHAFESLLRETARQQGVTLTGTLATCSGCVQAKGRRSSVSSTMCSRMEHRLHRVILDLGGLYLILFKDDPTCIGMDIPPQEPQRGRHRCGDEGIPGRRRW